MEEILYWVKTKRAPCLYRYDTANNKCSEAQASKVKATPKKNNNEATPKKRKKRKLSIFDDSESEKNEKNIYFENATQPVPRETVLSSCKDSIISENELNIKGNLNLKSSKIRKVDTKKPALKPNRVSKTSVKRTLRSFGKIQNLDSSLESGLFSGETKNKQSSISKSVSKKSVDKFDGRQEDAPKGGSLNIDKRKPVKGLFDDISDVSGFTANYIRSTKQSSLSNKLNKSKQMNRQLIKESQNNGKRHSKLVICTEKSNNTTDKSNTLNCIDSYNIINLMSKEEPKHVNGNIKLDKITSMLKFVEPKSKGKVTPRAGRRTRQNDTLRSKESAGSPYFTRSKVGTYDEFFKTDNTSTPIKSNTDDNKKHTSRKANAPLDVDNNPESSCESLNIALAKIKSSKFVQMTKNGPLINNNKDKNTPTKVKDKSGFAQCFSESDDELPQKKFFA